MIKMKHKYLKINFLVSIILMSSVASKSQFTKWENNKAINNIVFEKVRYKSAKHDTLFIIGYLKNESTIEAYPVAADLVRFTKEFKLLYFKLAKPFKLEKFEIAADTWVSLEQNGYYICALPKADTIQGYTCMGGNGKVGNTVMFDSKGNLRSFFSPTDIKIGNIFCSGGKSNEIGLLANGSLGFCTLSIDHNINDVKYKSGLIVSFDFNGNVSSIKEK
jgi:hypothetical protein